MSDPCDNCPDDFNPDQLDMEADGVGDLCDTDLDGDSVPNASDNCPLVANDQQEDRDGDGLGDVCDINPDQADSDGDGVDDGSDNCPSVPNSAQADADSDGVGDVCDNCPNPNPTQADSDHDGLPDACENCPTVANVDQSDVDADGTGDLCDNCPDLANASQADGDGDRVGDLCDLCPAAASGNPPGVQGCPLPDVPVRAWFANNPGVGSVWDMASSSSGDIHVLGWAGIVKYNSVGEPQWFVPTSQFANTTRRGKMALDAAGNVYAAGAVNDDDYVTLKYNAAGAFQWERRFEEFGYTYLQMPFDMAADAAGNVCITATDWFAANPDYVTIKYDTSGAQQWLERYDGTPQQDVVGALAFGAAGSINVTGSSDGDIFTINYGAGGAEEWTALWESPSYNSSDANAIAVDALGSVYVAGDAYSTKESRRNNINDSQCGAMA